MQFYFIAAVILGTVLPTLTAPTSKRDAASQMKEQMQNFQSHMASLGDEFKSILANIKQEKSLKDSSLFDKRGVETSNEAERKKNEKEMREKLKEIAKQLKTFHKELHNLREKVHSMKESLEENDGDNDDDDSDFDLDRREVKVSDGDDENPECIKKSIVQESDPFILRVSLTIMKRINAKESREYIEKLVNVTTDRLVAKMKATHGIKDFRKRVLNAVLQLLKVRSILTIKTEGQFIDELDERKTRTLEKADKDVDQSKVVQALEELLEGPLIQGFVSKGEEKKMIETAMKVLGKAFRLSTNTTETVTRTMIHHVEEDVKNKDNAMKYGKQKGQPMTDDEKIKGLQKMVADKTKENKLNMKEMKFLVKGLAAAIAARNKISADKTEKLENKILKGVEDIFAKVKIPENKGTETSNFADMMNKYKDVPIGFQKAQYSSKYGSDKGFFRTKDAESVSVKEQSSEKDKERKRTIYNRLKELEELITKNGGQALPKSLPNSRKDVGDKGDNVVIDAATNTRGATRIVEKHNGKRDQIEDGATAAPTEVTDSSKQLRVLLKDLEELITKFKNKIPSYNSKQQTSSYNKKFHEKVLVDAAKGTLGARKIETGFKRKRGLLEIVSDAISLIKSLKAKQDRSMRPTEAVTTYPTELTIAHASSIPPTEMATTKKPTIESMPTKRVTQMTLKTVVEPTTSTLSEEVGQKAKKSFVSDAMEAEIERSEAEIQKDLEEQQKKEEAKMIIVEEKKKEEEEQRKEKEREEKEEQKQKEQEAKEKQKEKEQEAKEKQKEKEQEKKEKQKQKEEREKQKDQRKNRKHDKKASNYKKSDITGISEAKIEADEKEIQKELEAQTNGKSNLLDKLQSLQRKEKQEKTEKEENDDELMKELDELFAKN